MFGVTLIDILVGIPTTFILLFLGYLMGQALFVARQSVLLEDIAMYQTHISRLEAQRYTALPVVRQLSRTLINSTLHTESIEAQELLEFLEKLILTPTHFKTPEGFVLIPDLALLQELADTWQLQAHQCPESTGGEWASTAIELCAAELSAVLHDNKSFIPTSIRDGVRVRAMLKNK